MSTTIDNRVVEMQFDNRHFETNVRTTLSTLDKLKQSLNLSGAAKGLESLNTAANGLNLSGMDSAIGTIGLKFSALSSMALGAFASMGAAAVSAASGIISAFSFEPISAGFSEYETQMGSIQTILANTQSKGSTLEDVTGALDELNKYADQTIYNFTEMTRNIGTFTAAGVDLDTSVSSIKGIANLAAVSGSTSQQASTAMYQLSQALAAGKVSLMDWNSVVNAGMGGELFKEALKRTSRNLGTGVDEAIKKYGTFRESLTQGEWLTTEVLTETLTQLSGAYTEADLISQGYTQEQAKQITELAQTAVSAATEVKTFTQLWDTLKESAQSGWTQSWEIIIGDFEEAKKLFTGISDTVGGYIEKQAEARNKILEDWDRVRYDDAGNVISDGGRAVMIEALATAFKGLLDVIKPIKEAFAEVFDPITGDQLYNMTVAFKEFASKIKLTDETADKLKRTFKGVFSIVELFGKAVGAALKFLSPVIGIIIGIADVILSLTAILGDFFTALNESAGVTDFFSNLSGSFKAVCDFISEFLQSITGEVDGFKGVFSSIGDMIGDVLGTIGKAISDAFAFITENTSLEDILNGLMLVLTAWGLKDLPNLIDTLRNFTSGGIIGMLFGNGDDDDPKMMDRVKEILDSTKESISAFTSGIKAGTLATIAIAIGILSASLNSLSKLDPGSIAVSLGAIAAMLVMLNLSFKSITKSLDLFGGTGIVKAGFSMILIAFAIRTLVGAIKKIAEISFVDVVKGLFAISLGLTALCLALKAINKFDSSLTAAVSMIILAKACEVLGDALAKFGKLTWDEIGRGLTAMGGALAELTIVTSILGKTGGFSSLAGSASIFIAVQALDDLSEALKKFAQMAWDEIGRGLTAMGGALAELGLTLGLLGKFTGFSSIAGAGAIFVVAKALDDIAEALKKFGNMAWDEIGRGLTAMGGALAELGTTVGLLGKFTGFSGILGSGAIVIVTQALDDIVEALKKFGQMAWDEIGRGLTAMGGALAELGTTVGLLGRLTGFSGILGSGAIVLVVQGLGDLADAFNKFGEMSWDEIGRGLVGMGGALGEVAVISGALGALAGLPALLGGGAIVLAVQGLGDLADAFKKFAEMSWEEIGNGLAAMGGALAEVSFGSLINTLSGFGAGAIAEIAEPLGKLADSVKKWTGITVPNGLSENLEKIAQGIGKFTWVYGADALATSAVPLGDMAESVKKWTNVVVPEGLGDQLSNLATGVGAFTFGGFGASAIGACAAPLGVLAESISKWKDVTVPENIQSDLEALAAGVKAWTFGGLGAGSIESACEPLKNLAPAVMAWNNVSIPEGIQANLEDLAEGVKAWSFAFVGGWSIGSVCEPLKNLASAIKSWNGVSIPSGLGGNLESLATGVKAFGGANLTNVTSVCDGIKDIKSAANELSDVDFEAISSKLTGFASAISDVTISSDAFTNIGKSMVEEIVGAITTSLERVRTVGRDIVTAFGEGISKSESTSIKAMTDLVDASAQAANKKYHKFEVVGYNCAMGFANGIKSGSFAASIKARAMANAAADAAKKALDEHSPSKVFYGIGEFAGIGFVNALADYSSKSYIAGTEIATSAKNGLSNAIGRIADVINSDMDTQPTIRPVLDLSDIESGAGLIGGMLNSNGSIFTNVGSINASMNRRLQNGSNNEVVSAIDKLRRDVGNLENKSYSIGNISYSHGDEVYNAIETLVRAARVKGRA